MENKCFSLRTLRLCGEYPMDKQSLIAELQLEPHVEGGWFRRTYCSPQQVQTEKDPVRPLMSSIFYMLADDSPVGHLHHALKGQFKIPNEASTFNELSDGYCRILNCPFRAWWIWLSVRGRRPRLY